MPRRKKFTAEQSIGRLRQANPHQHRKPRKLSGVLRERVTHFTFLGENLSRCQQAAARKELRSMEYSLV